MLLSSLGIKVSECIYATLWWPRVRTYKGLERQHVWKGTQGVYIYLFGIVWGILMEIMDLGATKGSLPQPNPWRLY